MKDKAFLTEAEAAFALAERLTVELEARGARPLLLRGPAEDPPEEDRIRRANRARADALVAVHMNSHDDPSAEGTSSYYFGRMGTESVAGRTLAEAIRHGKVAARRTAT